MSESDAILSGRTALLDAVRQVLVELPEQAPRRVVLLDAEFGDWPIDEPQVLEALSNWARPPGRQLVLIGLDFDSLARQRPRFGRWRRAWAHRVDAFRPGDLTGPSLPAWLLAGNVAIEWLDRLHWRGRRVAEAAALRTMDETTDAILQRCEPSWPVTTLGL
jgi:hypothetical protein